MDGAIPLLDDQIVVFLAPVVDAKPNTPCRDAPDVTGSSPTRSRPAPRLGEAVAAEAAAGESSGPPQRSRCRGSQPRETQPESRRKRHVNIDRPAVVPSPFRGITAAGSPPSQSAISDPWTLRKSVVTRRSPRSGGSSPGKSPARSPLTRGPISAMRPPAPWSVPVLLLATRRPNSENTPCPLTPRASGDGGRSDTREHLDLLGQWAPRSLGLIWDNRFDYGRNVRQM